MKTLSSRSLCLFVPALLCAAFLFVSAPAAQAGQAQITVDQDLVIPMKDMSATAIFYPVEVGGIVAEFFAVKAPDNTVRVVVNACQSCGSAGFVQVEDNFQCTACGQFFNVSAIERQKGGCNPIPVGDANKKIEQDRIILPLVFLRKVTGSRYAKGKRG